MQQSPFLSNVEPGSQHLTLNPFDVQTFPESQHVSPHFLQHSPFTFSSSEQHLPFESGLVPFIHFTHVFPSLLHLSHVSPHGCESSFIQYFPTR